MRPGWWPGALSLEAIKGSVKPFDARIHAARGQVGQIEVAARRARRMLDGSEIVDSHKDCGRVQDPYSIRCQPQVDGRLPGQPRRHAARILRIEANAASDNPLVFPEQGDVVSGGNFHAEPVAFAADILALAIAEIGAISERRLALLLDTGLSGLPPFLVRDGGLQLRLHDRAGDGGGARFGEQVTGPSVQRGQPAHLRQPGRPCVDGHLRRAPAGRDGGQHGGDRRHRGDGRRAGYRIPPAAEVVAAGWSRNWRASAPAWTFVESDRYLAPDIEAMKQWVRAGRMPGPAGLGCRSRRFCRPTPVATRRRPCRAHSNLPSHKETPEDERQRTPIHPDAASAASPRTARQPRSHCKNWLIEAAYRMIQNNLDPDVAERPQDLVVYGGIGKAARNWECFDAILDSLRRLGRGRVAAGAVGQAGGHFPYARRMRRAC